MNAGRPAGQGADSSGRMLQLCAGYLLSYVLTGVAVKVFTGGIRQPPMPEFAYLLNSTIGGSVLCLAVVFALGWVRLRSNRRVRWGPWSIPSETGYIVLSGVCTAVVIPTTTLMYSLPVSVMVAMIIMRGSIIVISRVVDAIQIRQGLLRRRVYAEENWATVFALLAVGTHLALAPMVAWLDRLGMTVPAGLNGVAGGGQFEFMRSGLAVGILGSYVVAYAIRIYVMNYFKNTRAPGVDQDNRGYFAIEQIAASLTMALVVAFVAGPAAWLGWNDPRLADLRNALHHPDPAAILSGIPYGLVAFFSVFIFMLRGRTATFAGLVNRLTSLIAGTVSTLLLFWLFRSAAPKPADWMSLAFILVAVGFLAAAERRRTRSGSGAAASAASPGPGTIPARAELHPGEWTARNAAAIVPGDRHRRTAGADREGLTSRKDPNP